MLVLTNTCAGSEEIYFLIVAEVIHFFLPVYVFPYFVTYMLIYGKSKEINGTDIPSGCFVWCMLNLLNRVKLAWKVVIWRSSFPLLHIFYNKIVAIIPMSSFREQTLLVHLLVNPSI